MKTSLLSPLPCSVHLSLTLLLLLPLLLPCALSCSLPTPPLSTVQHEAAFIGDIGYRDSRQSLFPSVAFSCSGAIVKWTVVASEVGGGTRYPQFSVWRNTVGTNWDKVDHNRLQETDRTSTPYVYEKTVSADSQIQFQAGDVLGVYTPPAPRLSFKYQREGGPENYYVAGISEQRTSLDTDGVVTYTADDVPLLSIETTNPECVSGLINRDTLLIKAGILAGNVTDVYYRQATQRIIPGLAFPCDGSVTKFTMAALSSPGGEYPEMQVWRNTGGDAWVKVQSVSSQAAVVQTDSLNVHQYLLPGGLALRVQQGDVLGMYQPYTDSSRLRIYLSGSGPTNLYHTAQLHAADTFPIGGLIVYSENRLPLITMEISAEGTTTTVYPPSHTSPTSSTLPPSHTSPTSSTLPPSHTPTSHTSPTSSTLPPSHTPTSHTSPMSYHTSTHPQSFAPFITLTQGTSSLSHTLTPSTSPRRHGNNNTAERALVVALATVSVVLVMGGGVMVVLAVIAVRRRRSSEMLIICCHMSTEATNPIINYRATAHYELEYNPMYQHRNPKDIIQNGRHNTLSMYSNTAYTVSGERERGRGREGGEGWSEGASNKPASQAQQTREEHIYESIPI